jgi:hypothetical protein
MKTSTLAIAAAMAIVPVGASAAERSYQIMIYELRVQTHMEKRAQRPTSVFLRSGQNVRKRWPRRWGQRWECVRSTRSSR